MTTLLGKSYNFLAFQQRALLIYLSATFFFSETEFFWLYLRQTSPSLWWIVYLLLFCKFKIVPLLFIFLKRAIFYNKQIWIFFIIKPWSWSFLAFLVSSFEFLLSFLTQCIHLTIYPLYISLLFLQSIFIFYRRFT